MAEGASRVLVVVSVLVVMSTILRPVYCVLILCTVYVGPVYCVLDTTEHWFMSCVVMRADTFTVLC